MPHVADSSDASRSNRYKILIERIFLDRYVEGVEEIAFERADLVEAAKMLGMELPKNLGDVIYSVRYRTPLPETVLATQTADTEWIIEGAGRSRYVFRRVRINRIVPNPSLVTIKVPDATPEIILAHALSDEQALLAKMRYNRLIDVFLGRAAYSLQNHLRTTVRHIGQIEIDEIYVGLDRHGRQYVLPVQAKGGSDQLSVVQTKQDIACCAEKFPGLICRSISAQFMSSEILAIFELTVEDEQVKVVDEKHYQLVPYDRISADDLRLYSERSRDA